MHLIIFVFAISFFSKKQVQMAKILICNEKNGEIFTANTSNQHLHLRIGAKV